MARGQSEIDSLRRPGLGWSFLSINLDGASKSEFAHHLERIARRQGAIGGILALQDIRLRRADCSQVWRDYKLPDLEGTYQEGPLPGGKPMGGWG